MHHLHRPGVFRIPMILDRPDVSHEPFVSDGHEMRYVISPRWAQPIPLGFLTDSVLLVALQDPQDQQKSAYYVPGPGSTEEGCDVYPPQRDPAISLLPAALAEGRTCCY